MYLVYLSRDSFLDFQVKELKVYDLTTLEKEPANFPPTTDMEAIYVAFSLKEVKTNIIQQHQNLKEWSKAYESEVCWTVTAEKTVLSEMEDNQWQIVFQSNIIPNYICDVTFTDSGILRGDSRVVCGHDLIK